MQDATENRVATGGVASCFFKDRCPIHPLRVPFPLVITDANSVLERLGTATNWSFNSTTLASASYYFPFPPATSLSFHPNCFDVREPLHVVVGLSIFWVQLKSSLAWLCPSLSLSLSLSLFLFSFFFKPAVRLFILQTSLSLSFSLFLCLVSSAFISSCRLPPQCDRQRSSGTIQVALVFQERISSLQFYPRYVWSFNVRVRVLMIDATKSRSYLDISQR